MASDIYYDLHIEGEDEIPKTKRQKAVALFFKSVFWIILAVIMGIFFWRMYGMSEIGMSDDFLANEITLDSINEHKNDQYLGDYDGKGIVFRTFRKVKIEDRSNNKTYEVPISEYGYNGYQVFTQHLTSYFLYNSETQEYDTITRSEYSDKDSGDEGNLKVSNIYYMPQSGQVCVTFRYNRNAENNLIANYPSAAGLDEDSERFLYVLSDNKGKTYTAYSFLKGERSSYTYRRLLFDGVDFSEVSQFNLDIYYINSDDFSSPYRSMVIYDENITLEEKNISLPSNVTSGLFVFKDDN